MLQRQPLLHLGRADESTKAQSAGPRYRIVVYSSLKKKKGDHHANFCIYCAALYYAAQHYRSLVMRLCSAIVLGHGTRKANELWA